MLSKADSRPQLVCNFSERCQRSELVYQAGLKIENRFLLSTTVMGVARLLRVDSGRTEDTLTHAFADMVGGSYVEAKLPEIAPPPPIGERVVPHA